MANVEEYFVKDKNNLVRVILTKDDVPVSGSWTQLDIYFGGVTITRNADGNGVTLDTGGTGELVIDPGDLTEDLSSVTEGKYRVKIVLTDTSNNEGVVFGEDGDDTLHFIVREPPP